MENYLKLNQEEYKEIGSCKLGEIFTNITCIEERIGDMFYYFEENYPDDDKKTSVCIGFKNKNTGKVILLWDYKVWNYYNELIDPFESIDFSVYYEDETDYEHFKDILEI